jgi:hypothetical protein
MPSPQPQPHITVLTTPPFHKAWLGAASLFLLGAIAIVYGKEHSQASANVQKRGKTRK